MYAEADNYHKCDNPGCEKKQSSVLPNSDRNVPLVEK